MLWSVTLLTALYTFIRCYGTDVFAEATPTLLLLTKPLPALALAKRAR